MKHGWMRAACCLLAVVLTASLFAACGKKNREPADSLIASETFVNATVQEMDSADLDGIMEKILGGEWDGDLSKLTAAQTQQLIAALKERGYTAAVKNGKLVYYSYTPTADEAEIAEVVRSVRGDDTWDGKYSSLTSDEKTKVESALRERGYDVQAEKKSFKFYNASDRKAETTKSSYNRLPNKEQLSAVLNDTLGLEGFKKWDGKFASLTPDQQEELLRQLNDYGFDLDLDDEGYLYIVHAPQNKMVYDSARTGAIIGGTTEPTTVIETTASDKPTENLTGTTAARQEDAIALTQEKLSTYGNAKSSFRKVIAAKDGGYLAIGYFNGASGPYADTNSAWKMLRSSLVKYDKNGNVAWMTAFGTSNARQGVWLQDVTQLRDGSFVAVGYTDGKDFPDHTDKKAEDFDGLIVKVSEKGETIWQKTLYGAGNDMYYRTAASPDGGFVAGAQTDSSDHDFRGLGEGIRKAVIQKFDADGAVQWTQALNSGTYAAQVHGIAVTDDGAVYAAIYAAGGTTLQMDMAELAGYGAGDSIVVKYNAEGEMLAHRAIAGSGTDEVACLALAEDGGVVVGGSFTKNVREDSVFAGKENRGKSDAFLVSLDAKLNVRWVKTFGGAGSDDITGVAPVKGGYIVCGISNSDNDTFSFLGNGKYDAFLMTVTDNGTGVEKYGIGSSNDDEALGVASAGGRQAAVVGLTHGANSHFLDTDPAGKDGSCVSFIEWVNLG